MYLNKKLLVVDDDLEVLRVTLRMVRELSDRYTVFTAKNVDDAYQISLERSPDIIITDWYMPDKTGIELIAMLKANAKTKDIPVIVTTGVMLSPEDLSVALEAGAIDYMRKPIVKVELQARVNSALLLSQSWKDTIKAKDAEINQNAIYLAKNTEFLRKLTSRLSQLDLELDDSLIKDVQKDIDEFLKSNAWARFETSFQGLHGEFNKRLISEFPHLSPKEMQMCDLLLLGMSSKNIASVFSITEASVKVARYRIRKKMDLAEKENLQTFLAAL
jgi:DNA-binding response OmpR family regulator/DNA-binding CsgD family transcriptional regulator